MKIGIFTFHWGTNYGAILQSFCLQNYLESKGHEVVIINYQPKQYEFSWFKFLVHPNNWKNLPRQLIVLKKERILARFRKRYLNLSKRFYSVKEFENAFDDFDVFISGSDQVLNPGFTLYGEQYKPSPVYWLNFGREDIIRIGYAVSFGREVYPQSAIDVAKPWVNGFSIVGVREQTGLNILDCLNYKGPKCIVPDPTVLIGKELFKMLNICKTYDVKDYICIYMLRREIKLSCNAKYIDETHQPLTMEQWLEAITHAKGMVTNSYHGAIISILAHVPFVVLLETGVGKGMNDRFYTLLSRLGAEDRIVTSVEDTFSILDRPIDFKKIDSALAVFKKEGIDFFNNYLEAMK